MRRLLSVPVVCAMLLPAMTASVRAQAGGGEMTFSGSVRVRTYSWDWFGRTDGDYTYPATLARAGVSQKRTSYDWMAELALPIVVALPSTAVAAAPQGQLGLGGSYFAANSNTVNNAALFLKQGYVRFVGVAGIAGQSIKIGRMEFNDGVELLPKDPTLAGLRRDRISQRLLGAFGFSDVGRSIDGVHYTLTTKKMNVTGLAGRPTQGVFQVNGWPELNINLAYGALTRQIGGDRHPGEWRAFGIAYEDVRHGVLKVDNRPAAVRSADTGRIAIGTYGGDIVQMVGTPQGPIDLLAWGAVQTGKWGALSHRAAAYALEAGWQPSGVDRLKPWFRGGLDYASGDGDPSDGRHETFFQVLPTPRIYARLPFYNLMNSHDAFGEAIVHPLKTLTVRTDVHALHLAQAADLWYSGGGAFQPQTFGYTGRPSNRQTNLATLWDVSADYTFNPRVTVTGYYGDAIGHGVARSIYPASGRLQLAYAELLVRF